MACTVCGLPSAGNHFGVKSCRACSAFFRRGALRESSYKCKKTGSCQKSQFGGFECKKCRMDKCLALGMDTNKFQLGRDLHKSHTKRGGLKYLNLIETSYGTTYIDLKSLLNSVEKILNKNWNRSQDSHSTLLNLSNGLSSIRELPSSSNFPSRLRKLGRNEKLLEWEDYFIRTATWLTYFDDFQSLPLEVKMKFFTSIWHSFIQFDKLALNALGRKRGVFSDNLLMTSYNHYVDLHDVEVDYTWFTNKTQEEMKFFAEQIDWNMISFIPKLIELAPDPVELTFMISQICLSYAGKRYQGDILKISEKFQEMLANDLHNYYQNQSVERYSGRLSQLMKFVRTVEKDNWNKSWKIEVGLVFDVYTLEFSHPDVFKDNFV